MFGAQISDAPGMNIFSCPEEAARMECDLIVAQGQTGMGECMQIKNSQARKVSEKLTKETCATAVSREQNKI